MFLHPLLMAAFSVDIAALVLLLAAGTTAFRAALHWQPLSTENRQLALETAMETASIQGRTSRRLFLFSSFLLIFGIANLFHEDTPGAMCGTGVFQAMNGGGPRLLLYRSILVLLLQLWAEVDKLNRLQEDMPLAEMNARFFLVIPPLAILASIETHRAFAGLSSHGPVDCCAVVYDQFRNLQQAESIFGLMDKWWVGAFIVLSTLLVGMGAACRFSAADSGRLRVGLAAVCLLWLPVAAFTLVNVLAAYHYGVLHHHCPWCLFLPEHGLLGYPLYGAMGVIGLEGCTVFTLPRMVKQNPCAFGHSLDRCRQAGMRIAVAAMVFLLFAAMPPILWRLRYGVWMTG